MTGALDGKAIILTGAAGGQGQVAARLMIEAGARVLMTDRDPAGGGIAQDLGAHAAFMAHDITSQNDWSAVVDACVARFGGVDGLMNNAAIAGRDSVEGIAADALRRYFEVNVIGALHGIQAVLGPMRARGGGSIVNVASISALRATPGLVGYGTSKWALRGLTRNAAVEFAAQNIRVNLVLPGAVAVQMIKDGAATPGKASAAQDIPAGRVARPEEIVRASIFLLSDAASYVTGEELTVDGGWCA